MLALPFALAALLSLPALAGTVHLVVSAAGRDRPARDRLERLALAVVLPVVPVAAAGYAYPHWHANGAVRLAELAFGVALLVVVAVSVRGSRRSRPVAVAGPVGVSAAAGTSVSATLHALSLALLAALTGLAFVGHALGWFSYALR